MPPEVVDVLSREEIAETGAAIAACQRPDGSIAWEPGLQVDPWNHVEAAMALDVAGCRRAAESAYEWLRVTQRGDGSWAAAYRDGDLVDAAADANFTAYVATGAWHHYLSTLDDSFLVDMWPPVERAVAFTLGLQAPGGEIWWARDSRGKPWRGALLTSSSCIYMSLRSALAIADQLGYERPDWVAARHRLSHAIAARELAFENKDRYAMDWYYPVLAGALSGEAAKERIASRWDDFVIDGVGVRCVSDRPWVTAAETSELVLALDALGLEYQARTLFSWLAQLRAPGGAYWTGVTVPEREFWPDQKPAWTSGAVLLAADALGGEGLTAGLFRGESFVLPDDALEAAG